MQFRLRTILLIVALALIAIGRLVQPDESEQFRLFMTVLIILGVPHGALDLYIERRSFGEEPAGMKRILVRYLLNILVYAALWYFLPLAALVIFILISAYHFGEIDWIGKTDKIIHRIMYFLLGLCWITHFLSANVESALKIFFYLGESKIAVDLWMRWAAFWEPVSLAIIGLLYLILFFGKTYFYHSRKHFYFSLAQLMILLIVGHYSSLWIGFGFYFGLWHSMLSFDKIRMNFEMKEHWKSWWFLIRKALPFSIMAWMGMLFVMFMFYNSTNQTSLITLLFITLSVLTLPHLQVFTRLKNIN